MLRAPSHSLNEPRPLDVVKYKYTFGILQHIKFEKQNQSKRQHEV